MNLTYSTIHFSNEIGLPSTVALSIIPRALTCHCPHCGEARQVKRMHVLSRSRSAIKTGKDKSALVGADDYFMP